MASRLKGSETPELAGAEQPLGISVFRAGTERLVPPSGGSKADFHLGGGSAVHEAFLPDDRNLLNGDVAGDGVHIQQTGAVRLAFRDAVDVAGNRVAADLGPNAFRKLHVHVAAGAFQNDALKGSVRPQLHVAADRVEGKGGEGAIHRQIAADGADLRFGALAFPASDRRW